MKRRSARPFTVEIKHTRTSRASLPDAPARSRVGDDLWGDLQAAVADKPAEMQPLRLAHPEPAPSVAHAEPPARRVLPSLVPMFAMPVEPDAPEVGKAPEEERLPRVQRVKPPTKRKQKVVAQVDSALSFADADDEPDDTPVVASPDSTQASGAVNGPALVQARTARRAQQAAALRPGERWKRRLPRALW